ncbi:MaoC family dehydratase [Aureimonas fodinaquatilis]|uniref:MaoC family dehydratase n=1 Tax=Aureimonas fodinaquatilis TaxID=2565783 RepID=A0A5B0E212_9HYPH|nr:MaoC family dehydratase [Aureimonas fodinaquatilis]KAA0971770.1 MaoC family dehydratase [Aureimonas fodinaquatilis]
MSFYDDIREGMVLDLGAHTFTADEIIRFAEKFDPQPFHLSEEQAKTTLFGGLCASGWHTAAVFMKRNVATMATLMRERASEGLDSAEFGPSPGIQNMRWLRPVFAGETIQYRTTVVSKRHSQSRPGWGLIESLVEAENQAGQPVLSMTTTVFVRTGA